jgi:hypothetical protein
MSTRTRASAVLALLALAAAPGARAAGWNLVGHLGGVSAEESISGLDDLDWTSGVADVAVERSVFGPIYLGVGAEVLLDTDELAVTSREAGFGYAKLRLPLPLRPYAGLGLELRRATRPRGDGTDESDWHSGRVLMAGLGLTLYRVSFDLELRATRTDVGDAVLRVFSVRPGITLWL